MHAILVTSGSGGDVFPFIALGCRLKERGHKVTLLTHCCYEEKARKAGFDFVPLDSPSEYKRFF